MTSPALDVAPWAEPSPARPLVEITVPVHNEAHVLEASITTLHAYLTGHLPFTWRITIAENASTDATWSIAQCLAATMPFVDAVHLDGKGRGRALRTVWSVSDADILAYMDVDLSTGLAALLPLLASIISGHSDVAIGSRLAPGAVVRRTPKRELISRAYNLLLRVVLRTPFRDAQCGFKAVRADTARALLPRVEDNDWFFDTELLVQAQRAGVRIYELPVDWVDDADSRVAIWQTALDDLRGVARLRWGRRPR